VATGDTPSSVFAKLSGQAPPLALFRAFLTGDSEAKITVLSRLCSGLRQRPPGIRGEVKVFERIESDFLVCHFHFSY
jgi:hypothetical protein